jgi:hypothetical protein
MTANYFTSFLIPNNFHMNFLVILQMDIYLNYDLDIPEFIVIKETLAQQKTKFWDFKS